MLKAKETALMLEKVYDDTDTLRPSGCSEPRRARSRGQVQDMQNGLAGHKGLKARSEAAACFEGGRCRCNGAYRSAVSPIIFKIVYQIVNVKDLHGFEAHTVARVSYATYGKSSHWSTIKIWDGELAVPLLYGR